MQNHTQMHTKHTRMHSCINMHTQSHAHMCKSMYAQLICTHSYICMHEKPHTCTLKHSQVHSHINTHTMFSAVSYRSGCKEAGSISTVNQAPGRPRMTSSPADTPHNLSSRYRLLIVLCRRFFLFAQREEAGCTPFPSSFSLIASACTFSCLTPQCQGERTLVISRHTDFCLQALKEARPYLWTASRNSLGLAWIPPSGRICVPNSSLWL